MVVAVEIAISTPGPGLNAAASETDKNNSQVETVIAKPQKNPIRKYATPREGLQATPGFHFCLLLHGNFS
jgi:hypothetical protein